MSCLSVMARLLPEERRKVLEHLLDKHGLTLRELSKIMGVSPAAASRYLHGTLSVPPDRLCKAVEELEPGESDTVVYALEVLWEQLLILLRSLESELLHHLLERIADDVAAIMVLKSRKRQQA